jgi:hypothetical protein
MSSQVIEVSLSLSELQVKDLQRFHETTEDGQGYDVPPERMTSLARAGLIRSTGFSRYEFTDAGSAVVKRLEAKPESVLLDERLKAAGMYSVAEMLKGAPLDQFLTHNGVHDIDTFFQWVEMKRSEYLRMWARYELGDKPKGDLYEWVCAHQAVFSEVHVNLKAVIANQDSLPH